MAFGDLANQKLLLTQEINPKQTTDIDSCSLEHHLSKLISLPHSESLGNSTNFAPQSGLSTSF
jgi:hypothetical protein